MTRAERSNLAVYVEDKAQLFFMYFEAECPTCRNYMNVYKLCSAYMRRLFNSLQK